MVINCPKCNFQNDPSAKFCISCGSELKTQANVNQNSITNDSLILIFVGLHILIELILFIAKKAEYNWFEKPSVYFLFGIFLISILSVILLPFSIKNRTLKLMGLILSIIYIAFSAYDRVIWLSDSLLKIN